MEGGHADAWILADVLIKTLTWQNNCNTTLQIFNGQPPNKANKRTNKQIPVSNIYTYEHERTREGFVINAFCLLNGVHERDSVAGLLLNDWTFLTWVPRLLTNNTFALPEFISFSHIPCIYVCVCVFTIHLFIHFRNHYWSVVGVV